MVCKKFVSVANGIQLGYLYDIYNMETAVISSQIHLKWRFKNEHSICVTEDSKLFNTKTSRFLKQTVNGGYSDGFWIGKKFILTSKINELVELIPDEICPF